MSRTHWQTWHEPYDEPDSYLARRLAVVQRHIRAFLDAAPSGPIHIISMCAGQGRDLLEVLADHPRRADVVGRLVELDEGNASVAQASAAAAGLDGIEVVCGDASLTDAYVGAVPAGLVLVCGVFGNIADEDIRRTVVSLPQFCAAGATVVWTRHRLPPDVTPTVRSWFAAAGFQEVAFDAPSDAFFGVGCNHLVADPVPLVAGQQLFEFVVGADGAT
jgi:hypothetical protein